MSRINFVLSWVELENSLITLGTGLCLILTLVKIGNGNPRSSWCRTGRRGASSASWAGVAGSLPPGDSSWEPCLLFSFLRPLNALLRRFLMVAAFIPASVTGPNKQNFEHKVLNFFLSISFNISLGCSKEPSHGHGSFEYPQHIFWLRNKKIIFITHPHPKAWSVDKPLTFSTLAPKVNLGYLTQRFIIKFNHIGENSKFPKFLTFEI